MKERLIELVNKSEALLEEIKARKKEVDEIETQMEVKKGDDLLNLSTDHFVKTQYMALLSQELYRTIDKIVECYTCAKLSKEDIELSETEQKIVDNYLEKSVSMFLIDKGKVVSKQDNLLGIMQNNSKSIKDAVFFEKYAEQVLANNK